MGRAEAAGGLSSPLSPRAGEAPSAPQVFSWPLVLSIPRSASPTGGGEEEDPGRDQRRVRAAAERAGGEEAAAANQPQGSCAAEGGSRTAGMGL